MDKVSDPSELVGLLANSLVIQESNQINRITQKTLDDLPKEIKDMITRELDHNDRKEFSKICRSCRYANWEYIYESLHFEAGVSAHGHALESNTHDLVRLGEFLRTATGESLIRSLVKSLSLKINRRLCYEQISASLGNLKFFNNLKKLSLTPPPHGYDIPYNEATETLHLSFDYDRQTFWDDYEVIPPIHLLIYLENPFLRRLQIEHISLTREFHDDLFDHAIRNEDTSMINDLCFVDCSPYELGLLPEILVMIWALRIFVLETNCPWAVSDEKWAYRHKIAPKDLDKALESHSKTLEEMAIAFSDGASFLTGTAISLKGYSNLKKLAIPEPFLAGVDGASLLATLPYQLEELQLQYPAIFILEESDDPSPGPWLPLHLKRDYHHSLDAQASRLHQLAYSQNALLPQLKQVIWWQQFQEGIDLEIENFEKLLYTFQSLWARFDSVGVKFAWVSCSSFGETPFGKRLGVKIRHNRGKRFSEPEGLGLYYDEENHCDF